MLRLYRNILKHHRTHLPPQLRRLGNETVRHEWKQHKSADAAFVKVFEREWTQYLTLLQQQQQQRRMSIGRDLDATQRAAMNDEQRDALRQLEEAATIKNQN
jgi:hypothetical protein